MFYICFLKKRKKKEKNGFFFVIKVLPVIVLYVLPDNVLVKNKRRGGRNEAFSPLLLPYWVGGVLVKCTKYIKGGLVGTINCGTCFPFFTRENF